MNLTLQEPLQQARTGHESVAHNDVVDNPAHLKVRFWVQPDDEAALLIYKALAARFEREGAAEHILLHHASGMPPQKHGSWTALVSQDMGPNGYFCKGRNRKTKEVVTREGADVVIVLNNRTIKNMPIKPGQLTMFERAAQALYRGLKAGQI